MNIQKAFDLVGLLGCAVGIIYYADKLLHPKQSSD